MILLFLIFFELNLHISNFFRTFAPCLQYFCIFGVVRLLSLFIFVRFRVQNYYIFFTYANFLNDFVHFPKKSAFFCTFSCILREKS